VPQWWRIRILPCISSLKELQFKKVHCAVKCCKNKDDGVLTLQSDVVSVSETVGLWCTMTKYWTLRRMTSHHRQFHLCPVKCAVVNKLPSLDYTKLYLNFDWQCHLPLDQCIISESYLRSASDQQFSREFCTWRTDKNDEIHEKMRKSRQRSSEKSLH